jgi:nitroimidazol reductase NimA-like FMN-containing flavoprotein (pyridoxamine 5'-phosphate oxidase superfamily)
VDDESVNDDGAVSSIPPPFLKPDLVEREPVQFEEWERERISSTIGVVSTVGPDGTPHAAPVQIWLEDDAVRFETDIGSKKYRNLVADPSIGVLVFGKPKWGVLIQGKAEILSEGGPRNQAQFRVEPRSKASWRKKEG